MATPALHLADPAEHIEEVSIGALLRQAASDSPDVPALIEGLAGGNGRSWTFAELLTAAEEVARALLTIASPGDRVAIWAHNVPEWILVQYGAALAGITLVTINPALRAQEAKHLLSVSQAVAVVHVDEYRGIDIRQLLTELRDELRGLAHVVSLSEWQTFLAAGDSDAALPEVTADDIAQIQFTSGTTGLPKGATLTHRGLANNPRLSYLRHLPFRASVPIVSPMPLFHTAGSVLMVLSCLQSRSPLVQMHSFDPGLQLELIERYRSNCLAGVPTMLNALLTHPAFATTDLACVEFAFSGGAFVESSLVDRIAAQLGVPVGIIYAQTEASPGITMTSFDDPEELRRTTIGRPIAGVDVRIADPADPLRTLPRGEIGEIATRGFHVMAGYLNNPEQTAQAIDSENWLHTGDLGSMDDAGYLRVHGRLKDMIIRGGENIYATEVEAALGTHEGVNQSAVIGVPDAYWGEVVGAFVQARPGHDLDADELRSYLRQCLAPEKVPTLWWFVEQLPMNASGKILKTELRARAADEVTAEASA